MERLAQRDGAFRHDMDEWTDVIDADDSDGHRDYPRRAKVTRAEAGTCSTTTTGPVMAIRTPPHEGRPGERLPSLMASWSSSLTPFNGHQSNRDRVDLPAVAGGYEVKRESGAIMVTGVAIIFGAVSLGSRLRERL